ncbi:MAG: iron ABC transporter permease [Bacteroidia bacterium]|nr:iron ABC transporter permease [Bacteroidia bacterium]
MTSVAATPLRNHRLLTSWFVPATLLAIAVCIPLIVVLWGILVPRAEADTGTFWQMAGPYAWNTAQLLLFSGGMALLMGVPSAWIIATTTFTGRRLLAWLLVLPLAMPAYIAAYAWVGLFDLTGPVLKIARWIDPASTWHPDVMHLPMLSLILAGCLYPYVYLVSRGAFMRQSASVWDAARMLGHSRLQTFFSVSLPLARPAIAGGVTLVMMEILNDYGAARYFGVNTFTTGIFREWMGRNNLVGAFRLSGLLLVVVFGLVTWERIQRGRAQVSMSSANSRTAPRTPLGPGLTTLAWVVCLIPVLCGFGLPLAQLLIWAAGSIRTVWDERFMELVLHSVWLAGSAALICTTAAILLASYRRWAGEKAADNLVRLAVLGYAVPGAVIAAGVYTPMTGLNTWLNTWLTPVLGYDPGLFLVNGFVVLLFAYLVRFLSVGFQPVQAGWEKTPVSFDDSARLLGRNRRQILFQVLFPLGKTSILTAFLMVFVDVIKELPLTMILRPFNVDTLATQTYAWADDERLASAAVPALLILCVSLIPVIWLNRLIEGPRPVADITAHNTNG